MGTEDNVHQSEEICDDDLVIPDIISRNLFIGKGAHERNTVKAVSDRFRKNRMGIYCNMTIPSCLSIDSIGGKRDENNLSLMQSKSKAQNQY